MLIIDGLWSMGSRLYAYIFGGVNDDENVKKDNEAIVDEETTTIADQYVFNPNNIKYPRLWELYRRAKSVTWAYTDIQLKDDPIHWKTIPLEIQMCLKKILSFFVSGDGIVLDNLATTMYSASSDIREAQCFYGQQIDIEVTHAITYGQILSVYCDVNEINELSRAVDESPTVRAKAHWAAKWIGSNNPMVEKLAAFIAVEGIFFAGSFAFIFAVTGEGKLPGLRQSNRMIATDENMHCEFACEYFKTLNGLRELGESRIRAIFAEAVEIECNFWKDLFTKYDPSGHYPFMTITNMQKFIQSIADTWLEKIDLSTMYRVQNPFPHLTDFSQRSKTNQFEHRPTEYQALKELSIGSSPFDLID